jgi:cytochrome c oxidase assembly factor CtaG
VSPAVEAALASWTFEPWLLLGLMVVAWLYLRGWRSLAPVVPDRLPTWRAIAFLSGLLTLYLAVASPLDAFAGLLLQVHMIQHFLLMMVAPPLIWLGAPELPLLHGLSEAARREGVGPVLRWSPLQRLGEVLLHPVTCWLIFVAVTWLWHVPALYELALIDPFWHEVEHFSFFAGAMFFWFPVVLPWPSRSRISRWLMVPYLFLAALQATVFSAFFVFVDRVLYPIYETVPRIGSLSALEDQRVAGAIMWVPGSLVLLATTMLLVVQLLSPTLVRPGAGEEADVGRTRTKRERLDLLRWPLLGALLRGRTTQRALRVVLALSILAIVVDGLFGPPMAAMNLAGVVPWTYGRALALLGLLVVGNVFCFACPFLLPRTLARRFLPQGRSWPRALRSKWLAVGLVLLFLWAYEVLGLWNSAWWSAWVLVAYFGLALLVDGFFRGASFCKYVCPIGQFNFIGSFASPLEVGVRKREVCADCHTNDCISGRPGAAGCELDLYLPAKVGNLDCTFCMDCVRACPHDNVGLFTRTAAMELATDPPRASFGRLGGRSDVAALVLVLVFGAFANAAGMVAPVVDGLRDLSSMWGAGSLDLAFTVFLIVGVVIAPVGSMLVVRWWLARKGPGSDEAASLARRLAMALAPLGIAMWTAHLLFHLAAGMGSGWPVVQRVLGDLGMPGGAPDWSMAHVMGPLGDDWIILQILLLDLGLLSSLYLGWRIAQPVFPGAQAAMVALLPWVATASLLFSVGIWLLFQPMEMRGMLGA